MDKDVKIKQSISVKIKTLLIILIVFSLAGGFLMVSMLAQGMSALGQKVATVELDLESGGAVNKYMK